MCSVQLAIGHTSLLDAASRCWCAGVGQEGHQSASGDCESVLEQPVDAVVRISVANRASFTSTWRTKSGKTSTLSRSQANPQIVDVLYIESKQDIYRGSRASLVPISQDLPILLQTAYSSSAKVYPKHSKLWPPIAIPSTLS